LSVVTVSISLLSREDSDGGGGVVDVVVANVDVNCCGSLNGCCWCWERQNPGDQIEADKKMRFEKSCDMSMVRAQPSRVYKPLLFALLSSLPPFFLPMF
jgi:hypothetical protein